MLSPLPCGATNFVVRAVSLALTRGGHDHGGRGHDRGGRSHDHGNGCNDHGGQGHDIGLRAHHDHGITFYNHGLWATIVAYFAMIKTKLPPPPPPLQTPTRRIKPPHTLPLTAATPTHTPYGMRAATRHADASGKHKVSAKKSLIAPRLSRLLGGAPWTDCQGARSTPARRRCDARASD